MKVLSKGLFICSDVMKVLSKGLFICSDVMKVPFTGTLRGFYLLI